MKASYDEPALCRLLDLTTPLLGRIEPYGPVERVREYLQEHDLTERLCGALRQFQGHLREEMSITQTSLQSLRQTLHVLLWQDEWDPMDPARCWSECVRRDFRAMAGDRRARWRGLLKHIRGNAPVRMPASWAREASGLLTTVTTEDFGDAIEAWFAPFRSGTPLPLSVAGSHVLKGLIWYCAVGERPELKERALWLLQATWRQKRNTDKALVALSVFGVTKDDLRAAHLTKPEPPAPPLRVLERLAQAAAAVSIRDRVHADGEELLVQGQLHFYRLSPVNGRVVRVTDGVALDLHWPAVPDEWRLMLHRECDSEHQLRLRAMLLVQDATFGRYFQPTRTTNPLPAERSSG